MKVIKKLRAFQNPKIFLRRSIKKIQSLSIANVNIIVISQIEKAVVFVLEKIIKGLLELNGNTYYLHHISLLNLILGKMGILIVKIKKERNLKEENVLIKLQLRIVKKI